MITETKSARAARATAPRRPARTPESVAAHERAIELLQSVAGTHYQDGDPKWDAVLAFLNLPLCYQPAVQLALANDRWKRVRDPKAYVATVAYRRALRENLRAHGKSDEAQGRSRIEVGPVANFVSDEPSVDGEMPTYDDQVDRLFWRDGEYYEDDSPLGDRVPDWLNAGGTYGLDVNWARVAEYAVIKKSMTDNVAKALAFMAAGMSRAVAMETAFDEEERAAIGAAWKWVDRNWDSRIVPLFHMEEPPAPVMKAEPPAGKSRGKMVPPWEALRLVCDRANRDSAGLAR
jgi:hypothetical protein